MLDGKGLKKQEDLDEQTESPNRRSFLGSVSALIQAGIGIFLTIPIIRYVLHPVFEARSSETVWTDTGLLVDIPIGEPQSRVLSLVERDGWSIRHVEKAIWVMRRPDDTVSVLAAVCPHLGCSINWQANSKRYNCACHQSYFDLVGGLLSGPSPRAMDTLEYRIEAGTLYVNYQDFKQLNPTKEILT